MKTTNGQTIFDIALQKYASVDAVFAIFKENSSLFVDGFTTVLTAGSELTLPNWKPEPKQYIEIFKPVVLSKIKTIANQTIYDIAISYFSSTDAVFSIFKENSSLFVDGFTTVLTAGSEITLPEWKPTTKISQSTIHYSLFTIHYLTPQIGQTLYDIALAKYGSANEVFELAKANNVSITDIFSHLNTIQVPEIKVSNPRTQAYFADAQIRPNSRIYPSTLKIKVLRVVTANGYVNLEVSVLNLFPYTISTMLKFDFDQLAPDLNPENQFTDAFDFGIDLPSPDAQFTYDTREINNLFAFQQTNLYINRAINNTRKIIISGIPLENQNQTVNNNIFCTKSVEIKY